MRVFGFAGWSGSGKTTLIEQLIPRLVARAGKVSLVKHAHHEFDIDQPGKDSFRHREAGCTEVLVSSARRFALIHELRGAPELTMGEALRRLAPCDLVLVEGYKSAPFPKLEVFRPSLGKPRLYPQDPAIRGIATDEPQALGGVPLPVMALASLDEIATFVLAHAAIGLFPIDDSLRRE
jgi:molybdopterin-guanine dinucleotide biosynthesis protein B